MPIFFRNKTFLFVVRSLRCVCQVAGISKRSNDKQKSFVHKKIGMLVFETLKNKKSDFLNSNTH